MKKILIVIYFFVWACLTGLFLVRDIPLSLLLTRNALIFIHIVFLIIVLPIYLGRYLIRAKKENRIRVAIRKVLFRGIIPVGVCLALLRLIFTYNQRENFAYTWDYTVENATGLAVKKFEMDGKIRGMSVYALGRDRDLSLDEIVKSNVEWLAVHPYMSQPGESSHEMSQPKVIGLWSKRDSMFIQEIGHAKKKNFQILIKPHLWVNSGWRANISFASKEEWNEWFTKYRANMLHYAQLAELTGSEMFCIGTELRTSLEQRKKWMSLIREIRQIYSGKLTYAANWDDDSFTHYPEFWEAIDYIGIQAYFPLTKNGNPNIDEIKSGWNTYLHELELLHRKFKKPIIFTELGYRADKEATVKPWEWNTLLSPLLKKKSEKTQLLAYEAFFQKIWDQPWFAGVFIWQWNNSVDFSIHGKPAQNCITKWYRQ